MRKQTAVITINTVHMPTNSTKDWVKDDVTLFADVSMRATEGIAKNTIARTNPATTVKPFMDDADISPSMKRRTSDNIFNRYSLAENFSPQRMNSIITATTTSDPRKTQVNATGDLAKWT